MRGILSKRSRMKSKAHTSQHYCTTARFNLSSQLNQSKQSFGAALPFFTGLDLAHFEMDTSTITVQLRWYAGTRAENYSTCGCHRASGRQYSSFRLGRVIRWPIARDVIGRSVIADGCYKSKSNRGFQPNSRQVLSRYQTAPQTV